MTCACGQPKSHGALRCYRCRGWSAPGGGGSMPPSELDLMEVVDGTRRGQSAAALAAHVGVSARTIVRYRSRLRGAGRL